jgi:hypothetical protein
MMMMMMMTTTTTITETTTTKNVEIKSLRRLYNFDENVTKAMLKKSEYLYKYICSISGKKKYISYKKKSCDGDHVNKGTDTTHNASVKFFTCFST